MARLAKIGYVRWGGAAYGNQAKSTVRGANRAARPQLRVLTAPTTTTQPSVTLNVKTTSIMFIGEFKYLLFLSAVGLF